MDAVAERELFTVATVVNKTQAERKFVQLSNFENNQYGIRHVSLGERVIGKSLKNWVKL